MVSLNASQVYRSESQKKVYERTFEFIAQNGWIGSGEIFQESLLKFVCSELDVAYALISLINQEKTVATTVSLCAFGKISDNISYSLKGTPCENVIDKTICSYTDNIQSFFPQDVLLVQLGAISYFGIPLWDSTGEVFGLFAVLDTKQRYESEFITSILQITASRLSSEIERGFIEKKLHKSEQKFKLLFDNAPDAMFVFNQESGVVVDVNESACKLIGKKRDELIGLLQYQLHPFELKAKSVRDFTSFATHHDIKDNLVECFILNSKDEWIPVEIFTHVIHFENTNMLLSTFRDITKRKKAEQKLTENQEMLSLTLVVSGAGFWSWDLISNRIECSNEMIELLGLKKGTDTTNFQNLEQCIHPDDRLRVHNTLNESIQNKIQFLSEYRIVQPDGSIKWIYSTGKCNHNGYHNPKTMSFVCIDITSRKLMEEDLINTNNRLSKTNSFFVDRELKMIELKDEINDLLNELGRKKKYKN